MKIAIVAITFAVALSGLFLFENYKTPTQEQNYTKIVSELRQTSTPTPSTSQSKTSTKTLPISKPSPNISKIQPTPTPTPSPTTPTPETHIYYTSSASQAKYYYCDTDSGWKNLSKVNLKQFSSPEELLKSYPNRTLHEPCK